MMKYYIFFLLLIGNLAYAQESKTDQRISKKKLIEQADYYFFQEDFKKALELYNVILDNYPKNHYVQYHKYVAYQLTGGRDSTLDSLKEYEANEGRTDKFYNYWLGRIYHNRYEFEEAQKHFQAFLDLDIYKTNEIEKETKVRLAEARKAQEFYLKSSDYEIVNMGEPINSKYNDVSPSFFADHGELVFMSSRDQFASNSEEEGDNFNIYHTTKESNKWTKPTSLSHLGTFSANNAKIEVVNNHGRLFMYQEEKKGLYFSHPVNDKWVAPVQFDSRLEEKKIASHFYIDDSETIIYFSAKSEKGDLDLYQSIYNPKSQSWSSPILVPGKVNSTRNEDSPFLSHDGKTLYFSSDNSESIGGFDVFMSEWDESNYGWKKPVNLGFPINTIDNEINFQFNEDNISGFFSSDRLHGKGKMDIYYFHKQGKVVINGTVYNKATGKPVPNARIDLRPVNYEDQNFRTTTDSNGRYEEEIFAEEEFKVQIYIGNQLAYTGKLLSEQADLHKSFERDFQIDIPDKVEETNYATLYDKNSESKYEEVNMLGSKFRKGEKAMLKNIYFDIHSANLTSESDEVLSALYDMLKKSPNLKVEIGGHTDNTGSLDANMTLSLARANSVKNYLVKKGIPASQLVTKGYGPSQPIASNDDEINGRELNRRIEVRVLN
ncbi:OmpA family protein [Reichenbachiella agarivorans]|uniref:OmpA family protein n=1 Tax=Reichenbachiella agarivorans TaxID=2979464 RepID=A0ABY6CP44_9BACT|nr:OmpA family protein [Reichenbachiella agarivorans]UXP31529.1 OmpA family protein [Reichenbachiella agarivorans]